MGLSLRLNLWVTIFFLITVLFGTGFLLHNARHAVDEEMRSSLDLTSRLIALAVLHRTDHTPGSGPALLERLDWLAQARHLDIAVVRDIEHAPAPARPGKTVDAPGWFVRLVEPEAGVLVKAVDVPGEDARIVITADAGDEIAEAWRETCVALLALAAFCLVANGLIFFTLRSSLAPVRALSTALVDLEQGRYDVKLERAGVTDIDAIVERFNHMTEVLARGRAQMTDLAERSLAIQEQERRRLAHELHDELGQSVSAIKALAVSIGQRAPAGGGVAASAATIALVCTDIYDVIRRMMGRLRPVILDQFGLASALATMVDDWNARHERTFCRFELDGEIPAELPEDLGINLYRIAQEALTNIAKHAEATEACVRLSCRPGGPLLLSIADNGRGFERDAATSGLGLVGIRERAHAVRGQLSLDTQPGSGTEFRLSVPLTASDCAA